MALLSGREAVRAIARGGVEGYRKGLEKLFKPRLVLEKELVRLWSASSFEEVEGVLAGVHSLLKGKGIGPSYPYPDTYCPRPTCFSAAGRLCKGVLPAADKKQRAKGVGTGLEGKKAKG